MMVYDAEDLEGAKLSLFLVGKLLYREPNEADVRPMIEGRVFDELPFGSGVLAVNAGARQLSDWCGSVSNGEGEIEEAVSSLRSEWLVLFGGAGSPKAPSWASYYSDPHGQVFGSDTLAVRAWYRRFGLQVERKNSFPDDELGVMLGFLAHLISLELMAQDSPEVRWSIEDLRVTQEEFLVKHLLPWISAWRTLMDEHSASGYYRGLANLAFGLCEAYALRFGVVFRSSKNAFVYER